ncbi:polysaccharide deacetylase family protein [Mycobacterium aquaticum]|nr:polysaccharide deacetylase family protein [Mycobacterium aquaticum]
MYHSVSDSPAASIRGLSVRPKAFAEQVTYLARNGFTGLTFGELCRLRRSGEPLPQRPVVLTFDDGYADLVEEALPVLTSHGFPATVFITTGWLDDAGQRAAGTPPDRMLTWRQLTILEQAGVEIGAHSHSHPQLDQISVKQLRAELADPKSLLEEHLGHSVATLAYPYGYSNRRVREMSLELGYRNGAGVVNGIASPASDPFRVPRLTVRLSTSINTFAQTVNQQRIGVNYAPTRALTAGYAVVRRSRSALRALRDSTDGS